MIREINWNEKVGKTKTYRNLEDDEIRNDRDEDAEDENKPIQDTRSRTVTWRPSLECNSLSQHTLRRTRQTLHINDHKHSIVSTFLLPLPLAPASKKTKTKQHPVTSTSTTCSRIPSLDRHTTISINLPPTRNIFVNTSLLTHTRILRVDGVKSSSPSLPLRSQTHHSKNYQQVLRLTQELTQ
ncbi:hypothetical protein BDN72DRAFT_625772 [Pluteus cervinus]|uniref:Uncharacterized protein n=1 Tax=Pluteus cervinus TaxID=181527 RepID=A0ACD3A0R7_9AGAR|nr:hypothetical protein BDN72DRAFT_625772 [Pluteus cervinus]